MKILTYTASDYQNGLIIEDIRQKDAEKMVAKTLVFHTEERAMNNREALKELAS